MNHLAYYLANGPSLAKIDLDALPREHAFGMNAAYRHWEKRNWWPAYYSSIDPVVSESHAGFIRDAVENKLFTGMMVSKNVLAAHPDLETYVVSRLRHLIFFGENPQRGFETCFRGWARSFGTTGAWTLRYGASLGYKHSVLVGYDFNFVRVGSRIGGPLSLKREIVDSTPNPNYFFQGYQLPGDKFQTPNPGSALFSLHEFAVLQSAKHLLRTGKSARFFAHQSPGLKGMTDTFFPLSVLKVGDTEGRN